jgi:hypothetical protein
MKLDPQSGLEKRARYPRGRKAQQSAGAGEFVGDFGGGVAFDGLELGDGVHGLSE